MATLALVGLSVAAAAAWYNSRGIAQPEHIAPPATTLDAIGLLARVSAWSLTETVKSWRPGDLTLGLYTTTRKDGRMWQLLGELLEEAPAGMCEVGTDPEWADSLILLLKLISYSTMLARSRKEPEKSSISRLCDKVRAMQADVLAFKLKSGMLRPAYILLRDWELQEIILVVRGTYTLKDTVTSLMGTTVPHHMLENVADGAAADGVRLVMGHAHGGMLTAARELATSLRKALEDAVEEHPGWGLRLVGHSLGGGTAFLLTTILRSDPKFAHARCVAFACPACVTVQLAEAATSFTTSIVCGEDVVPSLAPYTIKSLRLDILESAWREELRETLNESTIVRTASSLTRRVSTTASSATTILYSAARLTGKAARLTHDAVLSASSFTASVGKRIVAPLCSTRVLREDDPAAIDAASGVILYRLPSTGDLPRHGQQAHARRPEAVGAAPRDGDREEEEGSGGGRAPTMTAPCAIRLEDLDENAALARTGESERLTSDMLSALDISVSHGSLANLAEVAEAIKASQSPRAADFEPLEAQAAQAECSSSVQDSSVVSEEDIRALERELEIVEPKMCVAPGRSPSPQ